jgi:soluble lytic murein transglycosylase-like protein
MERVRDWVAERYRVSSDTLEPVLAAAQEAGRDRGIDPLLIVAIMAVESSFNPRAVSHMGAQGLMQVMPRYHQDKIGKKRGKNALFDPEFNVHVGTHVLHETITRYGSVQRALQAYNGSLGDPSLRYPRKVMAMKKRLLAAAEGRMQVASAG